MVCKAINWTLIMSCMLLVPLVTSIGLGPFRITSFKGWTTILIVITSLGIVLNLTGFARSKIKRSKRDWATWTFFWVLSGGFGIWVLNNPQFVDRIRQFLRSIT